MSFRNAPATLVYFSLLLLASACTTLNTHVEYDKAADFTAQKSYLLVPNDQQDLITLSQNKDKIDQLITREVNKKLQSKGYTLVDDNPDFLVSYYLVVETKTETLFLSDSGLSGRQKMPTQDHRRIRDITYDNGMLIVEVTDSKTNERIWSGFATSRDNLLFNNQYRDEQLKTAINSLLNKFPP